MKILTLGELEAGMVLAQDVYIEEDPTTAYLKRGSTLTQRTIARLHGRGVPKVYVEDGEASKPMAFTPIVPRAVREKQKEEPEAPPEKAEKPQSVFSMPAQPRQPAVAPVPPPPSPASPSPASPSPAPAQRAPAPQAPMRPVPRPVQQIPAQRPAVAPTPPPILHAAKAKILRPEATVDQLLRTEALSTLETAFSKVAIGDNGLVGSAEAFVQMDDVVNKLVRTVLYDRKTFVNISDLKSYDDYTYHHSLSVSVLSIAIGRQLGLSAHQLKDLGLSAIMHDIGKTAVPLEIIHKPARLDDNEYALIKTHAKAGTSFLISSSIGNEKLWRAVLSHHEKVDGTGYPNGLKRDKIPLWGRIIAVADVYDALTSQRPYRTAMQPADALEYIMGGVDTAFDYEIVRALMHKLDFYPIGSCLELSNGLLALVIENENQLRPVVELLGSGEVVNLHSDRRFLNVVIKRVVPENELAVRRR